MKVQHKPNFAEIAVQHLNDHTSPTACPRMAKRIKEAKRFVIDDSFLLIIDQTIREDEETGRLNLTEGKIVGALSLAAIHNDEGS